MSVAKWELDRPRLQLPREPRLVVPGCPAGRAEEIARHAATRGSGRVGRTAAGRALHPDALELAAVASIRHRDTGYDELLMSGIDRAEARDRVREQVTALLDGWRQAGAGRVTPAGDGL
jgi:hypothetical protein